VHRHRFRLYAKTIDTACLRCGCGEETERPTTAEEKKEHRAMWRNAVEIHRVWHAFAAEFTHPKKGTFRKKGYSLIEAVERYAARREDIEVLRCDDGYYAGSRLVLVRHRSKASYHGLSVIFIPQCTGEDPIRFFLYPNHVEGLLGALREEIRVAKSYPETRKKMRQHRIFTKAFYGKITGVKTRSTTPG